MLPSKEITRRWRLLKKRLIFRFINFWPPYLGSAIKVRSVDIAAGVIEVEMKLRWWNRNYVGTHYGGSLYSMCDPFYMLIIIERLGRGYVVWDKMATIRFRTPGRGTVRARFEVSNEVIERIRETADREGKAEPKFVTRVIDSEGQVVAEVEKLIHVKKERKKRRTG